MTLKNKPASGSTLEMPLLTADQVSEHAQSGSHGVKAQTEAKLDGVVGSATDVTSTESSLPLTPLRSCLQERFAGLFTDALALTITVHPVPTSDGYGYVEDQLAHLVPALRRLLSDQVPASLVNIEQEAAVELFEAGQAPLDWLKSHPVDSLSDSILKLQPCLLEIQVLLATQMKTIPQSLHFPNASALTPTGSCIIGGGSEDVQLFTAEGKPYAAKVTRACNVERVLLDCIWRECILDGYLRHRNILHSDGLVQLENVHGPVAIKSWEGIRSWAKYIQDRPGQAIRIVHCHHIAQAVLYLHQREIVHSDLKAYNVVIDASGTALLINFSRSGFFGTPVRRNNQFRYLAPEVILGEGDSYQRAATQDVYAFAMLCWELWTLEVPYGADFIPLMVLDDHRPVLPDSMPQELKDLLRRCWSAAPEARPTMKTVVDELGGMLAQG